MARQSATLRAGRIAGIYALVAGAWIWWSDAMLELLVADRETLVRLSVVKGLAYVVATTAMLLALVRRSFVALDRSYDALVAKSEALRSSERRFRDLAGSLEQKVAQRTDELVVARERAEEADRLKSAFLATMSHELRTPLNSIIGFTGILLQELAGPLNEEQHKQLTMVRSSARHLLALINDVLDLSKIEAGQLAIEHEAFDLREAIEQAVETVRPMADAKQVALEASIAPEVARVVGDRRRVEQVLLNLLNNAVKFTERGSVRLEARAIPDEERPAIAVAVADTGIGIADEDLGSLFQPFRQIDTGLTRQHEGTGLGLTISRRLADLMEGRIEVSSRRGEGSVFTLVLPVEA